MSILVTGGAGYIGSHICVELLQAGYEAVVVDNLCNSNKEAIKRVEKITGKSITFYKNDIMDKGVMDLIFTAEQIEGVIHLAGLKAVGESVRNPYDYYENNLIGTLSLCEVMRKYNVKKMIFSSSATVYGNPAVVPIHENSPFSAMNPYGRTKWMIEEMLRDFYTADPEWNLILLRYFNPIGAHKSGMIGEDPRGTPQNLVPYIAQVAAGKQEHLKIYGNDYDTPDGTGIRDYIHVVDLARGHVEALRKMSEVSGLFAYNLGTGSGYSVLEVISSFEKACKNKIPYEVMERRPGDIGSCYADVTLAREELGWQAQLSLDEMCEDSWRWQSNNPNGYAKSR